MKTLLAVVFCALALPAVARAESLASLTPQEVKAKLGTKNFYVFDNNEPEQFKVAHVPGAKWLNPSDYDAKALPADKNATLVFYCFNPH